MEFCFDASPPEGNRGSTVYRSVPRKSLFSTTFPTEDPRARLNLRPTEISNVASISHGSPR